MGRSSAPADSLVSQTRSDWIRDERHPYRVVTVVDAGSTGLRISQTDSYVVGDEFYRTRHRVSNSTGSADLGGPVPRGRLLPSELGRRLRLL